MRTTNMLKRQVLSDLKVASTLVYDTRRVVAMDHPSRFGSGGDNVRRLKETLGGSVFNGLL
jgi:hypothetical protein